MAEQRGVWAPPDATPEAKRVWHRGWTDAIHLTWKQDPAGIDYYMGILIQSFTYDQFRLAIDRGYDLLPEIEAKFQFDVPALAHFARAGIRAQWPIIYQYLAQPIQVRERIRSADPQKATLFDNRAGWEYLCALCWHILKLLREKGQIRGEGVILPPPWPCPLHRGLCYTVPGARAQPFGVGTAAP